MTDLEADSKGHESDDERSVSASNDFVPGKSERGDTVGKGDESETRSRTESKRSAASERDSHRSDTIGKDDESETKSRTESKRSEHEESDEHSSDDTLVDDEVKDVAKDVKHKEHRKGNKAFHALRNDQLDKVIDEYKSQFSKPESIGDAASMHSAMQQVVTS
ncbi:unnamed protein product [Anisakis simplex]|uniref:Small hydrophilic protein n=1 Tax=Anisakis simplex TaxID=6269 RepID=A0A0M3JE56_ANISI|nr:unnamed protein product [Anisakis simplex]